MSKRMSVVKRETKETNISLEFNIDGTGKWEINTGVKMFDHLLAQVAQHGRLDIKVSATGDDQHHLVEDVGICLGKALGEALEEKRGIVRIADAAVHRHVSPGLRPPKGVNTTIQRRPVPTECGLRTSAPPGESARQGG